MASGPKTKPTDVPVADFIAAVENPVRRADAETLCRMMEEVTGEPPVMWGPSIVGFGSYRTSTGDWPVSGFSPRKAQMVVYIVPELFKTRADLLARMGKVKTGVSCLYLDRLERIDMGALRELAVASLDYMRAKYPA